MSRLTPAATVKMKFVNEEPKSIWKKSWTGPHWLRAWLILVVAAFFIALIVYLCGGIPGGPPSLWPELFFLLTGSLIAATVFVLLWLFVRCFFSWRNFKRLLFALACFATLIALFYAEEDRRGWHAWNQFKYEWEAKGEHFDFASVVPPPVPDDQNFALTPIVFTSYGSILTRDGKHIPYEQQDVHFVERVKMTIVHDDANNPTNSAGNREKGRFTNLKAWQDYYRDSAAKTNEFPVPPQPQSPAADVLLALSKYDSAIEELRQASQLPYSRFPLNYDTECPAAILLPHLSALKRCSQALQLRSIAELQNSQPEKALDDVKLALQLTDKIHTEPFLISHLVRIAMLQIMLQPIWEGLAEHRWSEEQLVALDAELAKLDFLTDYGFAMRGERGLNSGIIEYLRQQHNHLRAVANLSSDGNGNESSINFEAIALAFGPSGWYDQSKLRIGRFFERWYLRVADEQKRTFSPTAVQSADAALQAEIKHWNPCRLLEGMLLPALGNWSKKCAYAQASVDMARTAMALERYRLAHAEFPESLDVLAPQFIAKVPHDVIGGQPLKYRREANDQFVLYSVGWNETDDGGVVGFRPKSQSPDISQGDWVWRYPAK
jgi:hypothetical protein